ncbi:MAG: universal stress protein [Kiloniellales bacterium]|nr:universal stress protein [Kiloniellales bacterium]MDJ0968553.1 universal stress protein [Kiloniellales bacterium]MDJ0980047.1 universal stress protein [Kiloniellales bacterium]
MQHDIKNLLYSTDLSQNSLIAFGYAAYLAKLTGADLHLLHVLEKLSDDAAFTLQAYLLDEKKRHEIIDLRVEKARKLMNERQDIFWAQQSPEDQKLRAQIKSITVCEAYPAEEILKSAKQHNCDLIVMGSHERGLSHTFLGSVAKSVLRRSHVPTLIVPLAEPE